MEEFHFELWEEVYTDDDIDRAFDSCEVLHFKQIFSDLMTIMPISSGHHLGSTNWTIKFPHSNVKLGYLSKSSLLARYPTRFNDQDLLDCDVMIIGSIVNPIPNYNFDTAITQLI